MSKGIHEELRMSVRLKYWLFAITILIFSFVSPAQASHKKAHGHKKNIHSRSISRGPVEARTKKEAALLPNYFAITTYKPNYILPYYYTGSPDNTVYASNTPNNEQIKHAEVKYQISLKVPLWKNILGHSSSLYVAYTQLSYWQLYNQKTFFRENDYEPELFLANKINYFFSKNWQLNFINPGIVHQSNGMGTSLQRGWDRVYLEAIASTDHWMVDLKPWYIYSTNGNNKNIAKFLGYGHLLVAYQFHQQVFSLQAHNFIENYARYATGEATWSFPLIPYVKGYVQVFSGYGQSLIEYNHRTNSVGVGLALNDWI